MSIHQEIKNNIIEALRAKDTIRLDTLRGLNALFLNELVAHPEQAISGQTDIIKDDTAVTLIKRSVKQRKDSIEQFEKGGRHDLAEKEKAELKILDTYMPQMMSKEEIMPIAKKKIEEARSAAGGNLDPKSTGKIVGSLMKDLAGRADGVVVKNVVEELMHS